MKAIRLILGAVASLAVSAPAHAATHYLVSSWFENGSQMCKYDNGTVLNVGGNHCPSTIQG